MALCEEIEAILALGLQGYEDISHMHVPTHYAPLQLACTAGN